MNQTLYRELLPLSKAPEGEHVFHDRYGRPFEDAKEGFAVAVKPVDIEEDIRFHDLRHTFGSHVAMQGGESEDPATSDGA